MIYLNFNPVVSSDSDSYESSITLTNSAFTEESYVWVYPEHCPLSETPAFLEIRNSNYKKLDPDEAAGPDNEDPDYPYYTFRNWVWVYQTMGFSLPDPLYDENGDLIINEFNIPESTNFLTNKRPIKVYFKELRGYLDGQVSPISYNMPTTIRYNAFNTFDFTDSSNGGLYQNSGFEKINPLSWESLESLFNLEGLSLRTLVLSDPEDEESEKVIDPELLDHFPSMLIWLNLPLSHCLNYFAQIFQIQVFEECLFIPERPTDEEGNYVIVKDGYTLIPEGQDDLSQIYFKRPIEIEYDMDIVYESFRHTHRTEKEIIEEQELEVSLIGFTSPSSLGNQGITSNQIDIKVPGIFFDSITSNPLTALEIQTYIKENRINFRSMYEFTTYDLPHNFYSTREWARINISVSNRKVLFTCAHLPKPIPVVLPPTYPDLVDLTYKGVITGANETSVAVKNVQCVETLEYFPGIHVLEYDTLITDFQITDEGINENLQGQLFEYKAGHLKIKYQNPANPSTYVSVSTYVLEGQQIESIVHTIDGFNLVPGINDLYDENYPDELKLEATADLITGDFNNHEFQFIGNPSDKIPVFNRITNTQARLTLNLPISVEDLKAYILSEASASEHQYLSIDAYAQALAEYWKRVISNLTFYVSMSPLVHTNNIYVTDSALSPATEDAVGLMMNMDLDTQEFYSFGVPMTRDGLVFSSALTSTYLSQFSYDLLIFEAFRKFQLKSTEFLRRAYMRAYRNYQVQNHTFKITAIPKTP